MLLLFHAKYLLFYRFPILQDSDEVSEDAYGENESQQSFLEYSILMLHHGKCFHNLFIVFCTLMLYCTLYLISCVNILQ